MPRLNRWAIAAALAPAGACAHEVAADGDRAPAWVVVSMAVSLALYAIGAWRLRNRAGRSRREWAVRGAAFAGGWLALAAALLSPLDRLGVQLFSVHMLQHELLMVLAAPLLVVAQPLGVWAWALAPSLRRGAGALLHAPPWRAAWRVLQWPALAWALQAIALWGWHVPALFELALHDSGWHTLQHTSFFATALLYWWTVLGARTREKQGVAIASLFTTMMHSGALGALIVLSPRLWYPAYAERAPLYGLSALEDQQLGGLLMWIPAGFAYFAVGLLLALRWSGLAPRRVREAAIG